MKERRRDGLWLLCARQETTHIVSTLMLSASSSDTTPLVCNVAGIDHKSLCVNVFGNLTVEFDLWFVEHCGKLEGPCSSQGGDWKARVPFGGAS